MKPVANASAYDFQGLAALRQDAKAQDPAALKEAARQFESLFTQMLLKSMREANKSFGDSMFGGEQGEFYQDMFDDQMAVHLAQGRGLGLADMLIRQLSQGPHPNPPPSNGGGDQIGSAGRSSASQATGNSASHATDNSASQATGNSASHATGGAAAQVSSPPPVAVGGQGGGVSVNSKADFIRTYLPHAERAAQQLGVDAHTLLAQAALETGWGKSAPCNNLFGVKAGERWSGASVNVPTLEFEDGVAVRKIERFRAYASPAESFMDYARLIANNPRYGDALGAGDDVASFASALQQGGYATDPRYADKIVSVAAEVRRLAAGSLKFASATPITDGGGAS